MKFKSDSAEVQYYVLEYLKLHEGKEVSISDYTNYVKEKTKKEFTPGVFSGVTTRLSSNPSKTGVSKSEENRGYYVYNSNLDKKTKNENEIIESRKIIQETLTKLQEQVANMNILECDLKQVSRIKDVIIAMEKALENI